MFRENGTHLTKTGLAIKVGVAWFSSFLWICAKTAKPTSNRLAIDRSISVCFFQMFHWPLGFIIPDFADYSFSRHFSTRKSLVAKAFLVEKNFTWDFPWVIVDASELLRSSMANFLSLKSQKFRTPEIPIFQAFFYQRKSLSIASHHLKTMECYHFLYSLLFPK